jgi:kynurenine 3-monooxygenase
VVNTSCGSTLAAADDRLYSFTPRYSMEMRSHVLMPMHHVRRAVDAVLSSVLSPSKRRDVLLASPTPFPTTSISGWSSLYNMVTFRPDVPYHEALRKEKSQKAAVGNAALLTGVLTAMGLGYAVLSRMTLLDRLRR